MQSGKHVMEQKQTTMEAFGHFLRTTQRVNFHNFNCECVSFVEQDLEGRCKKNKYLKEMTIPKL